MGVWKSSLRRCSMLCSRWRLGRRLPHAPSPGFLSPLADCDLCAATGSLPASIACRRAGPRGHAHLSLAPQLAPGTVLHSRRPQPPPPPLPAGAGQPGPAAARRPSRPGDAVWCMRQRGKRWVRCRKQQEQQQCWRLPSAASWPFCKLVCNPASHCADTLWHWPSLPCRHAPRLPQPLCPAPHH